MWESGGYEGIKKNGICILHKENMLPDPGKYDKRGLGVSCNDTRPTRGIFS